jgi:uncharacterized protein
MKAFDRSSEKELAGHLSIAATPLARLRGLIGKRTLKQGEGLLLTPCNGIHTFLMSFPIDVIFLDKNNRVVEALENLKPQRISKVRLSSTSAIELPAGTLRATRTVVGNQVVFKPD